MGNPYEIASESPGGDYLPLTGGEITGDLTVDGTATANTLAVSGVSTLDDGDITTDGAGDITLVGLTVTGAVVIMGDLPTSDPSNPGQLYTLAGVLKVSGA